MTGSPPREVAVQDTRMRGTVVEGVPVIDNDAATGASLGFSAQAGDVFEVAIDLPGGSLPVGEVHVVGRDAIASVELFPDIWYVRGDDALHSVGAVSVVRDADGRVLREAPLRWSVVRGDAVLGTLDADVDGRPDPRPYAYLEDACAGVPGGAERSATLRATLDGFTESIDLTWHCTDGVDEGCACTATRADERGDALLALFVVLTRLRRRG